MDHIERIQRAIDFIEAHLKDELPTETIAETACFSMWHFQRVFSSVVGDSVKDYVRRRRMASALSELGSTERRILDIAVDYRFESQEAFTRAFKVHFGRTPGECRKKGIQDVLARSKPRITKQYLDHLYGGMTMQPRFETVGEMKIVGLGAHFCSILSPDRNDRQVIPALWAEFRRRAGEIQDRKNSLNVGLCAVPDRDRRHPEEYFYLAGTEIRDGTPVPQGMSLKTIPAGRYAVFTHKGPVSRLEHTMRYIFGSWLPKSNEELREAPDFSIQGEKFKADSEDSELEIYIPVK